MQLMSEKHKTVLLVGDRDPIHKWIDYESEFQKRGWKTILLFYYWNEKHQYRQEKNKQKIRYMLTQPDYMIRPKPEEVIELEKQLNTNSIRSFTFTEMFLYRKSFSKVLCEAKHITEEVNNILRDENPDLLVQAQGAGLLRRIVFSLSSQRNIPNIYFGISWFKNRMFLHDNEMNFVTEYNSHVSIDKETYNIVKAYVDDAVKEKKMYEYTFKSKKKVSIILRIEKLFGKFKSKKIQKVIEGKRIKIDKNLKRKYYSLLNTYLIYEKELPENEYFYFPMHYTRDSQITLREQYYLRQEAVVEYIANSLPFGTKLVIKPHPHAKGDYSFREMSFLKNHENIVVLSPHYSTHAIIDNEKCVGTVIINSSVGFESLLYRKPIFTLGKFYGIRFTDIIEEVEKEHVSSVLKKNFVSRKDQENRETEFINALSCIYKATYPGSVYTNSIDYKTVIDSVLSKYNRIV